MAVKAQRAADCDPFACHVGRRGGEVRIFCGSIASACVLAGWASSRPLAPPALSTFCSMMVRFTPRPVTKTHLRALGRALRVRRIDGRHWEFDVRTVCSRAWGEVQRGSATLFWVALESRSRSLHCYGAVRCHCALDLLSLRVILGVSDASSLRYARNCAAFCSIRSWRGSRGSDSASRCVAKTSA